MQNLRPRSVISSEIVEIVHDDGEVVEYIKTTKVSTRYERRIVKDSLRPTLPTSACHLLADFVRQHEAGVGRDEVEAYLMRQLGLTSYGEVTNLIARTRRRGLIVNHGTRQHPIWVALS